MDVFVGSRNSPACLPGETLPNPSELLAASIVLRNGPRQEQPGPCLLVLLQGWGFSGPLADCLSQHQGFLRCAQCYKPEPCELSLSPCSCIYFITKSCKFSLLNIFQIFFFVCCHLPSLLSSTYAPALAS